MWAKPLHGYDKGGHTGPMSHHHHHIIHVKPQQNTPFEVRPPAKDLIVKKKVQQPGYFKIIFDVADFNIDEMQVLQDGKYIILNCEQKEKPDGTDCLVSQRFVRRCLIPADLENMGAQYWLSPSGELAVRVGSLDSGPNGFLPQQFVVHKASGPTVLPQANMPPQAATFPQGAHEATISFQAAMPPRANISPQAAMPSQATMPLLATMPPSTAMPSQASMPPQAAMPAQAPMANQTTAPHQANTSQPTGMPQFIVPPMIVIPHQHVHPHPHHIDQDPPVPETKHAYVSDKLYFLQQYQPQKFIRKGFMTTCMADNMKSAPFGNHFAHHQPQDTMPMGEQQHIQNTAGPMPTELRSGFTEAELDYIKSSPLHNNFSYFTDNMQPMSAACPSGHPPGFPANWTNMESFTKTLMNMHMTNAKKIGKPARVAEVGPNQNVYVMMDKPGAAQPQYPAAQADDAGAPAEFAPAEENESATAPE